MANYVAFLFMGELVEVEESCKCFNEPYSERSKDYILGRIECGNPYA